MQVFLGNWISNGKVLFLPFILQEAEQHRYAEFKKSQKSQIIEETVGNAEVKLESFKYMYDVIEKPGDTLLKDEDWKKVNDFVVFNKYTVKNCILGSKRLLRRSEDNSKIKREQNCIGYFSTLEFPLLSYLLQPLGS